MMMMMMTIFILSKIWLKFDILKISVTMMITMINMMMIFIIDNLADDDDDDEQM